MYIPWSNRKNVHMCLVHCVKAKIVGGGRALMLIQSEEGMRIVWCVVKQMTFPPPCNQEACTLLCCVSPTHNGNVTHGALLPFFSSPFLHHPHHTHTHTHFPFFSLPSRPLHYWPLSSAPHCVLCPSPLLLCLEFWWS